MLALDPPILDVIGLTWHSTGVVSGARDVLAADGDQVRGWLNPLGSARWDSISMCSPHHLRPARAGRRLRLTGKHGLGPDAAGEIRVQMGRRNQLEQSANIPSRL